MIAITTRASRPLFPELEAGSAPLALSSEELAKVEAHRMHAARKLKMARLLGDGDFAEEARAALRASILAFGRALAIESRLPEPSALEDALLPPLSPAWKEALPPLREFAAGYEAAWRPALERLGQIQTA